MVTVAIRLNSWQSPLFGDEAWHYYVARHLGQDPGHIHTMLDAEGVRIRHLFLWRPVFELLLLPAALVSFDAWRLAHLFLTSSLVPLTYFILRERGVRAPIALAGAAAVLLSPVFHTWSIIVFPDGLLTTAIAAALFFESRGRTGLATGFFVLAAWIKEVGLVLLGFLFLLELVAGLRRMDSSLCPLRLNAHQTRLALAGLIGALPAMLFVSQGGQFPGWSTGGDPAALVDLLFLLPWLAPVVFAGLAWPRTRRAALLALVYPLFFSTYRLAFNGGVELWYHVLPSFLAVVAAALVLDELWRRAGSRPAPRAAASAVLLVVGGLLAAGAFVPGSPAKAALLSPASAEPRPSLADTFQAMERQDADLPEAFAQVPPAAWGHVFLVDPAWFLTLYPFGERAATLRYAYTEWWNGTGADLARWVILLEQFADVTLVSKPLAVGRLSEAIRTTYADCTLFENPSYVLLDTRACAGRGERLAQAAGASTF